MLLLAEPHQQEKYLSTQSPSTSSLLNIFFVLSAATRLIALYSSGKLYSDSIHAQRCSVAVAMASAPLSRSLSFSTAVRRQGMSSIAEPSKHTPAHFSLELCHLSFIADLKRIAVVAQH